MTPKEKAEDLVDRYKFVFWNEDSECGEEILCTVIAKKCALIAVDEIIHEVYDDLEWWKEVKQEIEQL
jgi:plasmid rolling circle replication initiator protein Rep